MIEIEQVLGIALVVVIGLVKVLYDYERFKQDIAGLILVAEKKSREYLIETGPEKKRWVIENGYKYIPIELKPFISKQRFEQFVQFVYEELIKLDR